MKKKEKIFYLETMLKTYILGAKGIVEENKQLKAQIEKMKNCLNCKHGGLYSDGLYCYKQGYEYHLRQMNEKETCCDKWEVVE